MTDAPVHRLELYFDFSSPFAYLGAAKAPAVAAAHGLRVEWRPFLLGGLFRAIGTPDVPLFAMPAAKQRHVASDLRRWARHLGVPYAFPSRFPMSTVMPLRLAILAGDAAEPFIQRVFRAYWSEDRDIASPDVLAELAEEVGLPRHLVEQTGEPDVKARLRSATAEAAAAGVFGAPTFVVHDERHPDAPLLFWGQDRLPMVDAVLRGFRPSLG